MSKPSLPKSCVHAMFSFSVFRLSTALKMSGVRFPDSAEPQTCWDILGMEMIGRRSHIAPLSSSLPTESFVKSPTYLTRPHFIPFLHSANILGIASWPG